MLRYGFSSRIIRIQWNPNFREYIILFDVVLTVHRRKYVEIKCQLDASDEFLLQILLLAQHVSGTTMSIIRSSRILYRWLLPVVFGALVFKLSV